MTELKSAKLSSKVYYISIQRLNGNCVDPDEVAPYVDPDEVAPHLGLHCLQIQLFSFFFFAFPLLITFSAMTMEM